MRLPVGEATYCVQLAGEAREPLPLDGPSYGVSKTDDPERILGYFWVARREDGLHAVLHAGEELDATVATLIRGVGGEAVRKGLFARHPTF